MSSLKNTVVTSTPTVATSASIDPRVAEQMRIIKERMAAEAAAQEAAAALFAQQVEESKIVWEAELRVVLESYTFTVPFMHILIMIEKSGRWCMCREGRLHVNIRHHPVCPYGKGGKYYDPAKDTTRRWRILADGSRVQLPPQTLEEAKAEFCYDWWRKALLVGICKYALRQYLRLIEAEIRREEAAEKIIMEMKVKRAAVKAELVARLAGRAVSIDESSYSGLCVDYRQEKECYANKFLYNPDTGEISWQPSDRLMVPTEWITNGILPFLSKCPDCGAQTIMHIGADGLVDRVECNRHYFWPPDTKKRNKLSLSFCLTHGDWLSWLPRLGLPG